MYLLTVTEEGAFSKVDVNIIRKQSRGGSGIVGLKRTPKTGKVVDTMCIEGDDDVFVSTANGKLIRFNTSEVREMGRNVQGVRCIRLSPGDKVVSIT